MDENITIDDLEEKLAFFEKMYDAVRLVDPIQKRVTEYRCKNIGRTDEICHAYWGKGHICDNCISIRAYIEKKSFMKLEQSTSKIMLVTAVPVESVKQPVILELLKDTTDTMLIGNGKYEDGRSMFEAVRDINSLVVKDALTSLYNRRFLDERLPAEIAAAAVAKTPLSVIFIDIDNMKRVNDTFGHSVGDAVIKYAAEKISSGIKAGTGWAARYGGDEFLVCLPNTDSQKANSILKSIYSNFGKGKLFIKNQNIRVMISQGLVTTSGCKYTAEEIVKLADRKMYEIKKLKKNGRHD